MEIVKQNALNITFIDDEVNTFKTIIKKFNEKKIGYKKDYTSEELELLDNINREINDKEIK